MHFNVKAIGATGELIRLQLEAGSSAEAERQCAERGYTILAIGQRAQPWRRHGGRGARFPLLLFSQEFLTLLESGMSVVEVIETLAARNPRAPIVGLLQKIREGLPLSAALAAQPEYFPDIYVASVRAAERTGGVAEALRRYVDYQERLDQLVSRLRGAAIYPALLLGVGGLVVVFLLGFVVPRFAQVLDGARAQQSGASYLLLEFGVWMNNHWPALAVGLALGVAVLANLAQRGRLKALLLRSLQQFPGLATRLRVFHLARYYRTVGMLLRSGVPLVKSLNMAAPLLAGDLALRLNHAIEQVSAGDSFSTAMKAQGLTTVVAERMLAVGEKSGQLGLMLERAAAFHDDELGRWAGRATRLSAPLRTRAIVFFTATWGVLMSLPIFELAEGLG